VVCVLLLYILFNGSFIPAEQQLTLQTDLPQIVPKNDPLETIASAKMHDLAISQAVSFNRSKRNSNVLSWVDCNEGNKYYVGQGGNEWGLCLNALQEGYSDLISIYSHVSSHDLSFEEELMARFPVDVHLFSSDSSLQIQIPSRKKDSDYKFSVHDKQLFLEMIGEETLGTAFLDVLKMELKNEVLILDLLKKGRIIPAMQLFIKFGFTEPKRRARIIRHLKENGYDVYHVSANDQAVSFVRRRNTILVCKNKNRFNLGNVMQSGEEIKFIERHLQKDFIMLEWGSGGSTIRLSQQVKKYFSIEHDKAWYNDVLCAIGNNTFLSLVVPNIHWRAGTDGTFQQFKNYVLHVEKLGVKRFDSVLVDGRNRINCSLAVKKFIDHKSLVFIHDWDREEYHSLLEMGYKLRDSGGRVGLLQMIY